MINNYPDFEWCAQFIGITGQIDFLAIETQDGLRFYDNGPLFGFAELTPCLKHS